MASHIKEEIARDLFATHDELIDLLIAADEIHNRATLIAERRSDVPESLSARITYSSDCLLRGIYEVCTLLYIKLEFLRRKLAEIIESEARETSQE